MQCPNCGQETVNINGRHVCLDCGIEAFEQADFDVAGESPETETPDQSPLSVQADTIAQADKEDIISNPQETLNTEPAEIKNDPEPKEEATEETQDYSNLQTEKTNENSLPQEAFNVSNTEDGKIENDIVIPEEAAEGLQKELPQEVLLETPPEPAQEINLNIEKEKDSSTLNPTQSSNPIPIVSNEPTVEEIALASNKEGAEAIAVNDSYHGPEELLEETTEVDSGNPLFETSSDPQIDLEKETNPSYKTVDTIAPSKIGSVADENTISYKSDDVFSPNENLEGDFLPANIVSNGSLKKAVIITVVLFVVIIVCLIGYFKYNSIVSSLTKEEEKINETPGGVLE